MASLINGPPPTFPVMREDDPNKLTMADAYTSTRDAAGNWIAAQRADAAARGLWDEETGLPTRRGLINGAEQYAGALVAGTSAPGGGIRAYHGSPHDFERFDTGKIGTGEGAQAYGHGLYFAGNEGVAKGYRDTLSAIPLDAVGEAKSLLRSAKGDFLTAIQENKSMWKDPDSRHARQIEGILNHWKENGAASDIPAPQGHMYEVNINANPEHFLDWDKPLSEQSPHVQEALANTEYLYHAERAGLKNPTGGQLMSKIIGDSGQGAANLHDAGIAGIRYLDGGSRAAGEGSSNHVVFDAESIEIMKKYGLAGLVAGAGAAGADKSQ